MEELIGKKCICDFNLPPIKWPISGYPAFVVVDAVAMPMIKMRSIHAGDPIWVNAAIIETIREAWQ
jgi:hypothetical protein